MKFVPESHRLNTNPPHTHTHTHTQTHTHTTQTHVLPPNLRPTASLPLPLTITAAITLSLGCVPHQVLGEYRNVSVTAEAAQAAAEAEDAPVGTFSTGIAPDIVAEHEDKFVWVECRCEPALV